MIDGGVGAVHWTGVIRVVVVGGSVRMYMCVDMIHEKDDTALGGTGPRVCFARPHLLDVCACLPCGARSLQIPMASSSCFNTRTLGSNSPQTFI